VTDAINNLLANLVFIFERLNWLGAVDILLVATVIFIILQLFRGTQAVVLLRGALLLIALIGLLTTLDVLPAFAWLVQTTFPALLFAIPVIFAPEIRRFLERLGRAGSIRAADRSMPGAQDTISAIVTACARLSSRQHGALIVIQNHDNLDEHIRTGVMLNAQVTAELLLQVFYPNTPLHDGAVIVVGPNVAAAACVLPLSSSGILNRTPERQMGLRHRAALGISEISDAIAVVVSEETGNISIVHSGKMIRRLDPDRLENILRSFFQPPRPRGMFQTWWARLTSDPGAGDRKGDTLK
jgi:diadenylate cyclase